MRRLEHAHGIRFDTLDLGGGFPVGYDEPAPSLAELGRGIRAALSAAPDRYRIIIEPGRFVSAPAMTLVTRVVGTADRIDGRWAYLDEGAVRRLLEHPRRGRARPRLRRRRSSTRSRSPTTRATARPGGSATTDANR